MRKLIAELEEIILAGSGADAFREIFKLFYIKLYAEKYAIILPVRDPGLQFFNSLCVKAKREWPGVFADYEPLALPEDLFLECMRILQPVQLFGSDLSVIDAAFEQLLPEVAKGNRGQYFTPRHVIQAIVQMTAPKEYELVIDPAAGSGGFLLEAIRFVDNEQFAIHRIYGVDFDERAYMICKAIMLIAGQGNNHIYRFNSLEKLEKMLRILEIGQPTFDVVFTNPPFGGEIRDENLLSYYDLALNSKGKIRTVVERHILFLERVIQLLKPGGRAAIIVPQGILNNTNLAYVRNWLFGKARILGVIGLDTNTFKPYTNVKTSILLLQKWEGQPLADYPIFMAVSRKSGKNASGNLIFFDNKVASDLREIIRDFRKFAAEQKFNF